MERANPELGLEETRLRVSAERQVWPEGKRFAGVSSFGIGGTNVHLCLREAPVREVASGGGPWAFPVSAKTAGALEAGCARLARFVEEEKPELAAVAATLQTGRRAFGYRRVVIAGDAEELAARLSDNGGGKVGFGQPGAAGSVAFLFPGQGLQYRGIARELYWRDGEFRKRIEDGLAILPEKLAWEIREAICTEYDEDAAGTEVDAMRTGLAQPLLFLVEFALAERWMEAGVRPAVLLGHSLGELTAAAVAGVFPF